MEFFSGQFSFPLEILFFFDYNGNPAGSFGVPPFFPGVAQLVGRLLWEQEAARSSRATRTRIKSPEADLCLPQAIFGTLVSENP